MSQGNRTKLKQVDNTQNSKDNGAVSSLDNNKNTHTDTDPPKGRRIEEIIEERPIKKSFRGNYIQGGPDTDPPNS